MSKDFKTKLIILLILGASNLVMAKTTNWIATTNGNWSNSANWDNGVPVDGDEVNFDPTALDTSFMDIPNLTLLNLDLGGYANCILSIAANNLTVTGIFATNPVIFDIGSYSITVGDFLVVRLGGVMTLGTGSSLTVNGVVTGGGKIEQSGGLIQFTDSSIDLTFPGCFSVTGGVVEISGTGNQTVTVDSDLSFFDLNVSGGGTKTFTGPVDVQKDLTMEAGTFIKINTSATIGRDFLGLTSFVNAQGTSLIEIGRDFQVGAYTRGSLLKLSGTADAFWDRASDSDFGNVEITGNKTVSLLPPNSHLLTRTRDLIVHGDATLDLNGKTLSILGDLTVGGSTHGTISNSGTITRDCTLEGGTFDLRTKAFISDPHKIGWNFNDPDTLHVNGDSTILAGMKMSSAQTIYGYGNLITGPSGGIIPAFWLSKDTHLDWVAGDIEVRGEVGMFNNSNFTMSPAHTFTMNNTAIPAGFYMNENIVLEGDLIIAGTLEVEIGKYLGLCCTTATSANLGKNLIIESGASIIVEEPVLTVNGNIVNHGYMQIDNTITVQDSLINTGIINLGANQEVNVLGGN